MYKSWIANATAPKNATCGLPPISPQTKTTTNAAGRAMSVDHLKPRILIDIQESIGFEIT